MEIAIMEYAFYNKYFREEHKRREWNILRYYPQISPKVTCLSFKRSSKATNLALISYKSALILLTMNYLLQV